MREAWLVTNIGVDYDSKTKKKEIYRIDGPGRREGWSKFVDAELGNYDYLLGINTRVLRILNANTHAVPRDECAPPFAFWVKVGSRTELNRSTIGTQMFKRIF